MPPGSAVIVGHERGDRARGRRLRHAEQPSVVTKEERIRRGLRERPIRMTAAQRARSAHFDLADTFDARRKDVLLSEKPNPIAAHGKRKRIRVEAIAGLIREPDWFGNPTALHNLLEAKRHDADRPPLPRQPTSNGINRIDARGGQARRRLRRQ